MKRSLFCTGQTPSFCPSHLRTEKKRYMLEKEEKKKKWSYLFFFFSCHKVHWNRYTEMEKKKRSEIAAQGAWINKSFLFLYSYVAFELVSVAKILSSSSILHSFQLPLAPRVVQLRWITCMKYIFEATNTVIFIIIMEKKAPTKRHSVNSTRKTQYIYM